MNREYAMGGGRKVTPTPSAKIEAQRMVAQAEAERQVLLREAEIESREAAIAQRAEGETELRAREARLAAVETALADRTVSITAQAEAAKEARQRLHVRSEPVAEVEAQARRVLEETRALNV